MSANTEILVLGIENMFALEQTIPTLNIDRMLER